MSYLIERWHQTQADWDSLPEEKRLRVVSWAVIAVLVAIVWRLGLGAPEPSIAPPSRRPRRPRRPTGARRGGDARGRRAWRRGRCP